MRMLAELFEKNRAWVESVTRDDPEALELIRHDAAHVLAEAVQELFPGTQVTIGPVIENGFYYDFFRNEPFTTEDFAAIEKKMRVWPKIIMRMTEGSAIVAASPMRLPTWAWPIVRRT